MDVNIPGFGRSSLDSGLFYSGKTAKISGLSCAVSDLASGRSFSLVRGRSPPTERVATELERKGSSGFRRKGAKEEHRPFPANYRSWVLGTPSPRPLPDLGGAAKEGRKELRGIGSAARGRRALGGAGQEDWLHGVDGTAPEALEALQAGITVVVQVGGGARSQSYRRSSARTC